MGKEAELEELEGEEAIIDIYLKICVNLRNLRTHSQFPG
jgi:hypothetical protein